MKLPFVKMQGVGNDFVVVDGRALLNIDWVVLSPVLCDRRRGVGADGVLVLEDSEVADFRMRMHNPDGSEDVCGNGMRCIARFAREQGVVSTDTMEIETLAGVRWARLCLDSQGEIEQVSVTMGTPQFAPEQIPINLALPSPIIDYPLPLAEGEVLSITPLSTGSTHSVTFVETLPDDATFFRISPQVEHYSLFPERTSLMWCQVVGKQHIRLRIWERGAGETWGCGTGACASAVAAILKGFIEEGVPIAVESKGGTLYICWKRESVIEKTGPAVRVYEGLFPLER